MREIKKGRKEYMDGYYKMIIEELMPEEADYFVQLYKDNMLSIEEMRKIHEQQQKEWISHPERKIDLEKDAKTGLYYAEVGSLFRQGLLYEHLMVEQLYAQKEHVDWKRVTDGYDYREIEWIRNILTRPLVWIPAEEIENNCVVVGKVAREEPMPNAISSFGIYQFCGELEQAGLLCFADTMPVLADVRQFGRQQYKNIPEDMVLWDRLMCGPLFKSNPRNMLQHIDYIAKHHGAAKAIEIVEKFREDWQDIVTLGVFEIREAEDSEVELLHRAMFEEMDRQLRIWKKKVEEEKEQIDAEREAPKTCRYICAEKIQETGVRSVEEYVQMISDACTSAPTLGDILVQGRRLGYLNFHGDGKSAIYKHLKECFPGKIKFGYVNFTQYYD